MEHSNSPAGHVPSVCLESLEPRLLMSGNVIARVHGSWLDIYGDSAANEISISAEYTDGDMTDSTAWQGLRITAADGDTLIDGQSQSGLFQVRNIRILMRGGNDMVTLTDFGTLNHLYVVPGAGDDEISILNGSVNNLRLRDQQGDDTVTLSDLGAYHLSMRMGRGHDTVTADDIGYHWGINLGQGDDEMTVTAEHHGAFPILSRPRINGGGGNDTITGHAGTLVEQRLRSIHKTIVADTEPDPIYYPPGGGGGGSGGVIITTGPIYTYPWLDPVPSVSSDPVTAKNLPSGKIVVDPSWSDEKKLAAYNTNFAFDLYHQIEGQNDGNVFFSPLSISTAMGMLYPGAEGQTADQIAQTMSFLLDDSTFAKTFGTLLTDLTKSQQSWSDGDPFTLNIANSLWGQTGYGFLDDYLNTLQQDFQSEMHSVDFAGDPEAQRQTINTWVADKTNQMIKDLLPDGSVTAATRLVLANAIYFKGSWENAFTSNQQQAFHLAGGDVTVDMMKQDSQYAYTRGENFQAIEIPYVGGASMVVLMPTEGQFEQFDSSLTSAEVQAIEQKMGWYDVDLSLPKFGCEETLSLKDTLQAMGITAAFGDADFSGIDGTHNLFVSDVIHKAKIQVDEKGTEAAAATAIGFVTDLCWPPPAPPPHVTFTADRPFIYIIKDNATGSTLFMGCVTDAEAFNS